MWVTDHGGTVEPTSCATKAPLLNAKHSGNRTYIPLSISLTNSPALLPNTSAADHTCIPQLSPFSDRQSLSTLHRLLVYFVKDQITRPP
jgi:hypothetical protein